MKPERVREKLTFENAGNRANGFSDTISINPILWGGGGEWAPRVVFLSYLLNSLFLGAETFRHFLKFHGESFGIQFELVRFRSLLW